VYREVDVYEDVEIEVPMEKLIEVERVNEVEVPVDIIKESVIENRINTEVEKVVQITKTCERPVFNKQIKDIYIDKIVETR